MEEGDYHKRMNSALFEEWFNSVIPIIKEKAEDRPAVLIFDNASYHCRPEIQVIHF